MTDNTPRVSDSKTSENHIQEDGFIKKLIRCFLSFISILGLVYIALFVANFRSTIVFLVILCITIAALFVLIRVYRPAHKLRIIGKLSVIGGSLSLAFSVVIRIGASQAVHNMSLYERAHYLNEMQKSFSTALVFGIVFLSIWLFLRKKG